MKIKNARSTVSNIAFGLKMAFASAPFTAAAQVLIHILRSLMPIAQAFALRVVINVLSQGEFSLNALVLPLAAFCVMVFLANYINLIMFAIDGSLSQKVLHHLDLLTIRKVSAADYEFFDFTERQEILRIVQENQYVIRDIPWQCMSIVANVIAVGTTAAVLFSLFPAVGAIAVLSVIPAIYLNKKYQDYMWEYDYENIGAYRAMNYYYEVLTRYDLAEEMRLTSMTKKFKRLFFESWRSWFREKNRFSLLHNVKMFFANVLQVASLVITFVLAVVRYSAGVIGLGDIQYFVSLSEQMSGSVTAIFDMVVNVHTNLGKIAVVRDFLAWKPKIISGGDLVPDAFPEIRFENVGFRYPAHDEWVLRHCSFSIPSGKHVALVGNNGAGKSTIVKLILRLYDPEEGTIFINGVDARQYDPAKLRRIFGVQFQDVVVYSASIAQNVALCDAADCDDGRLRESLAFAGLTEYVAGLPDGTETEVTKLFDENGVELSGGLKQRLSLARAFYRQSDFLILDEPSASLDPDAEYMIFAKLANLWRGKSALLISHRLANVIRCDDIIVLDGGRVTESGTHAELLRKRGKYADLYNLQAEKYVAVD